MATAVPSVGGDRDHRTDAPREEVDDVLHRSARRIPALHRRQERAGPQRPDVRVAESLHGSALGSTGRRCARGHRPGGRRCSDRVRGRVGSDDRLPASGRHAKGRRCRPGQRRAAGPPGGQRLRETAPGDARAADVPAAVVLVLLRPGRQARGAHGPAAEPGVLRLHPSRARGRRRRHHPVEQPAAAPDDEARTAAGRRQHLRGQALRALPRIHGGIRRGLRRGRSARRGLQRDHRMGPRDR